MFKSNGVPMQNFETELHRACKDPQISIEEIQIDPNCLDTEDYLGMTPLYSALENKRMDLAIHLYLNGARDFKDARDPLTGTEMQGINTPGTFLFYLDQLQKNNPNAVDEAGKTLLHHLCAGEYFNLTNIQFLIEQGCDTRLLDTAKHQALDYACANKNITMESLEYLFVADMTKHFFISFHRNEQPWLPLCMLLQNERVTVEMATYLIQQILKRPIFNFTADLAMISVLENTKIEAKVKEGIINALFEQARRDAAHDENGKVNARDYEYRTHCLCLPSSLVDSEFKHPLYHALTTANTSINVINTIVRHSSPHFSGHASKEECFRIACSAISNDNLEEKKSCLRNILNSLFFESDRLSLIQSNFNERSSCYKLLSRNFGIPRISKLVDCLGDNIYQERPKIMQAWNFAIFSDLGIGFPNENMPTEFSNSFKKFAVSENGACSLSNNNVFSFFCCAKQMEKKIHSKIPKPLLIEVSRLSILSECQDAYDEITKAPSKTLGL